MTHMVDPGSELRSPALGRTPVTCREALHALIAEGMLPSESRVETWLDKLEHDRS